MAEYTQTLAVDEEAATDDTSVWGKLTSLNPKFPNLDLRDDEITIGRVPTCTFKIDDKRISGQHCKIIRLPDARKATGSFACQDVYMVEDLRYGCFRVNRC